MTKSDATVEFKYDHNGLRIGKIVTENGVATTTNYTLHGKLITHMTIGNDTFHFFYDAQSRPAKVSYNGNIYTYLHNLQGDIVGILDSTGVLVAEYKYDAWGKPISITGSLAATLGKRNPFRYRGYVYDEETELYDLHQRFYWSQVERFINADSDLGDAYLPFEHNLYGYCSNEPVYFSDSTGNKQTRPKPVASSGALQRWTYMIHDDHGEPKGDGSYYWHIHLYYRGVKMYSVNETGRPHDQRNNIQMGNRARKNGLQDALDKLNERNIWPPKGRGSGKSGGEQKSKKSIDRQAGSQLKQTSTASIHTMVGLMNGRTVPCILVNDPISVYAGSCAVPQGFGLNLGNALGGINDFIGGWNIFAIPEYAMN